MNIKSLILLTVLINIFPKITYAVSLPVISSNGFNCSRIIVSDASPDIASIECFGSITFTTSGNKLDVGCNGVDMCVIKTYAVAADNTVEGIGYDSRFGCLWHQFAKLNKDMMLDGKWDFVTVIDGGGKYKEMRNLSEKNTCAFIQKSCKEYITNKTPK